LSTRDGSVAAPAIGVIASCVAITGSRAAEITAADIVAAQLRMQGYACEAPVHAARDMADPDRWTVTCANATYRARLKPHQPADVERLH